MDEIVSTIAKRMDLYEHKGLYIGNCPFHRGSTMSLVVDKEKQQFACLSCGVTGDVYDFISRFDKLPREVVLERHGIPCEGEVKTFNRRLSHLNYEAAMYYNWRMTTQYGAQGLAYFRSRGLRDETLTRFTLGYANQYGNHLIQQLRRRGFADDEIMRAGLAMRDKNGELQDRFWNRVMFPLKDANGNFLGFTGRTLQADSDMKYCNTPETEIFRKREILYGMEYAKASPEDYFVLVEGNMDVISMHQAGFTNAIASSGTALTQNQCKLMRQLKTKVIIMYDTDKAGISATKRAITVLKDAGLDVYCSNTKPSKDPDEFLKNHGADEMQKRLQNAIRSEEYFAQFGDMKEAFDMLLYQIDPKDYRRIIGEN